MSKSKYVLEITGFLGGVSIKSEIISFHFPEAVGQPVSGNSEAKKQGKFTKFQIVRVPDKYTHKFLEYSSMGKHFSKVLLIEESQVGNSKFRRPVRSFSDAIISLYDFRGSTDGNVPTEKIVFDFGMML